MIGPIAMTNDLMTDAGRQAGRHAKVNGNAAAIFRFVPKELAAKCQKLVESYHELHGYSRLADMLWNSDARDIIECNAELSRLFKGASRSRGAKRANDAFVRIATQIVCVEALARDFAGWGKRFPAAKGEAEGLLVDFPQRKRDWFMDRYLFPSLSAHRELASSLAPSTGEQPAPEI
jgi:hypothetical protein